MTKVIVFTNDAGGVAVCRPVEMSLEAVLAAHAPQGARVVEAADLPGEEDFRDAWVLDGDAVRVDLDRARQITKARLRTMRAPLLAAQDVAFQRALETGADTSAIVAEKARLRDLPARADACATLAALRALTA